MGSGACLNHDRTQWFIADWIPDVDDPPSPAVLARALAFTRSVCWSCPVQAVCADYGRRQPAGMWGGLTRAQRDAAGLSLPEDRYCAWCKHLLPDGWPLARHDECADAAERDARRQARAQVSASRSCERCGTHLSPQARACLHCRHIPGRPLPNRPWPGS